MLMLLYLLILLIINVKYILISASCHKSVTTVKEPYDPKKTEFSSGELIFQGSFGVYDIQRWKRENDLIDGQYQEFQWYLNNISDGYVKDGILHIRPTFLTELYGDDVFCTRTLDLTGENYDDGCTFKGHNGCNRIENATHVLNLTKSARMTADYSLSFEYGTIEDRSKIPSEDLLWPAIWLIATLYAYTNWFASGGIDRMKNRGNKKSVKREHIDVNQESRMDYARIFSAKEILETCLSYILDHNGFHHGNWILIS